MAAEDEALAVFGLVRDAPPEEEHLHIWPEHWETVQVFAAMMTQWNMSMAGPTGLRYESLPVVLRVHGVSRADWRAVFDGVRVMESEALRVFAERRNG